MNRYLLVPLLLLPSGVAAQGARSMARDSAATTIDMRRCASQALEKAKRDLNRYLQEARRLTTKRALLDSAQTAWERYREITCRAAGDEYEGGTMKPLVVLNCLLDLTRRRLHDVYDHHLRTSDTAFPEPKP